MEEPLLVGNLDCEEEWAAAADGGARTARSLTRAARAAASSAATLLRAFAGPRAVLWTPEAVAPERVVEVPGLPRPRLVAGGLEALRAAEGDPAGAVLAWGETRSVRSLRGTEGGGEPASSQGTLDGLPTSAAAPWRASARIGPSIPEIAARVNHRGFALELAETLGLALPGARLVDSTDALARHLERGGAETSGGAWVVKAPLSAAGRDRVLGRSPRELGRPEIGRRLGNLLQRRGPLLFEPWVARTADFGCCAVVGAGGIEAVALHRLEIGPAGRFRGVELRAGGGAPPGLEGREEEELLSTLREVGRRLAAAGYSGPFGLDAYRWREPRGGIRFQPLGEINARMTFGLVARALVDRVREPLGLAPGARVNLRFGRRIRRSGDPRAIVPLVLPGEEAPGAWLSLAAGAPRE